MPNYENIIPVVLFWTFNFAEKNLISLARCHTILCKQMNYDRGFTVLDHAVLYATGDQIRLTWWARQMRSRSCFCRNLVTISGPKVKLTPRSFSPQPMTSLSGSDHRRSHSRPWSGTSVGRWIRRICSIDCRSGLKPYSTRKQTHVASRWLVLSYIGPC